MTVSFWIWEALWGLVDWESLHDELNRRGRRTLCQESSAEPLMAGGAWCWWEGWLQSFLVAPPLTDCFCWKVSVHWHDSFLFCSDAKEPEDSRTIQGVSLCFQSWKGRYQDQWFSYIFSGAMRSKQRPWGISLPLSKVEYAGNFRKCLMKALHLATQWLTHEFSKQIYIAPEITFIIQW